jgi:undecaprenyl-phosphate galactose phosphotransferase
MKNTPLLTLPLESPHSIKIKHIPVKRVFDVLFSSGVLILGAPIFLLVALLILCTSRGKVVFSHERIGRGGKPFRCYKFRTMYADSEIRLKEILENDPQAKKEWETRFKLQNDPRVTPVGKFLRKTSLDELPQFWNVLKGDLSIVGPRPVVMKEVHTYLGPKAHKILSIRPGITGLWQVSGRSDTSYETRVHLDEQYVEKRSFMLDLRLIAKTIPAMISSRGAY